MDIEERLRKVEVDMAVIKEAVTNHIPTSIQRVEDLLKPQIKDLQGTLKWVLFLLITTLITAVVNLAHRLIIQ